MAGTSIGPVQGVARTVVRTPLAKAAPSPSWPELSPEPPKPGTGISQTPRKLNANTKTMAAITILKAALVNCDPQPAPITPTSVANTRKTLIKPTEKDRFSRKARLRFSPAWVTKDMIFRPITGSTHGMKFRMNPATKAIPIQFNMLSELSAEAAVTCPVSSSVDVFCEPSLEILSPGPTCPRANETRPFRQPFSSQYW